jgi:site-specific recombinase
MDYETENDGESGGIGHNAETLARANEAAMENIAAIVANQRVIDRIMEKAREECAPYRDDTAALKKKCRQDYNIGTKPLGAKIRIEIAKMRLDQQVERMDEDDREQFNQLRQMELPLADAEEVE